MPLLNSFTDPRRFTDLKGVIFDCDGVLFDSLASNRIYYNAILSRLGMEPMTQSQEAYVHAHAVRESLAHIIPPERRDEMEAAVRSVDYRKEILPNLVPEPGLVQLLGRLRARGYKLGISTNRTNTMSWLADRFGLNIYFSPIATAGCYMPKPSPESLHVIMNKWKLGKHEVVFLGDTSVDERTARLAGVRFWAYKSPNLNAEMHVTDFWSMAVGMRLGPNVC